MQSLLALYTAPTYQLQLDLEMTGTTTQERPLLHSHVADNSI